MESITLTITPEWQTIIINGIIGVVIMTFGFLLGRASSRKIQREDQYLVLSQKALEDGIENGINRAIDAKGLATKQDVENIIDSKNLATKQDITDLITALKSIPILGAYLARS